MATLTAKQSVFDMDAKEIHEHLFPMAEKLKEMALDGGSWYSYKNELCVTPDMFIHEYKDGKKELIKLGNETGEYQVLKVYK